MNVKVSSLAKDTDPAKTKEWLESIQAVIERRIRSWIRWNAHAMVLH